MGCNCGKKKSRALSSDKSVVASTGGVVYDIVKDGSVIATKTDRVVARAEARRNHGTIVPRSVSKV